jgi:UDP-N-acetylmuramate dehydrogenase
LISIAEIRQIFKGKISLNEPLAPYTTFRIGGPADYYLEPVDVEDVINLDTYLTGKKVPLFVLGNGSNILISDEGIRGAVINLETGFGYLKYENGSVISGAGVKIARFVEFCIQKELAGVEMLAGIPATMGGALAMNAGAYKGEISDYVTHVSVVRAGKLQLLTKAECGFVYRYSALRNSVIVEAKFKLPSGNHIELSKRRRELLLKRNLDQPVEIPNAGCIFKNPKGNYAAKLVEECGLKGLSVGGAMVSTKHSNFIVNCENATAHDVIELIKLIRQKVKDKFNVELELEVKPIGFPVFPV